MLIPIGDKTFEVSHHADVGKLAVVYTDGRPTKLYVVKLDGATWGYEDDGITVPIESGTMPVGVYKVPG